MPFPCPAWERKSRTRSRRQWPVSSGIPLSQGDLLDDRAAALFDAAGQEVPLQTEALARWPDGSVRWLLLDFQIDLAAHERKSLKLRFGSDVHRAAVENPVRIVQAADGKTTIETGPVRLEHDPKMFMPQGAAWLTAGTGGLTADYRITVNCGSDGIMLQDEQGRASACPLSTPRTYISVCLAAEGMAYESQLTGNAEHLRVLREGLREMLRKTGSGDGKSLAQLIHFTPFALRALVDN